MCRIWKHHRKHAVERSKGTTLLCVHSASGPPSWIDPLGGVAHPLVLTSCRVSLPGPCCAARLASESDGWQRSGRVLFQWQLLATPLPDPTWSLRQLPCLRCHSRTHPATVCGGRPVPHGVPSVLDHVHAFSFSLRLALPPLPVLPLHPFSSAPHFMVMDAPPPVDGNDAPAPPRGPVRTAVDLAVDVVGRPAAEAVKPAVAAFKDAYPRGGSVVDDVARTVGGAAERVTTVADEAIAQRVQRYVCVSAQWEGLFSIFL